MNPTTNSRTRRTLADQLDRLDSILDGLSNALNESIATAVKEATAQAVQQAVQATLTEILTSPELLSLIGAARSSVPVSPPVPVPLDPGMPVPEKRKGSMLGWLSQKARSVRDVCSRKLSAFRPRFLGLWQLRNQLFVALGVGAVAGVVAYAAGPWMAGLFSGVAAFGTAIAVQTRNWLKRLVGGPAVASVTS